MNHMLFTTYALRVGFMSKTKTPLPYANETVRSLVQRHGAGRMKPIKKAGPFILP